ncbi:MAG TPA: AAA family ATPase [Candidatus Saccharimonadales bacterium]|nr:AAA family ATPase [Candidatus Saccharimonadales bacterium]
MDNIADTEEPLSPTTNPALDAPCLPAEAQDEPADFSSFWTDFEQSDLMFFKLPVFDQFLRRSYHEINLEEPVNVTKLAKDYREQTFRSETTIDRGGNTVISLLLLRLTDEVWVYLQGKTLKIYAPAPEAAQSALVKFRRYVKPQAASKPRFFIISIEDNGPNTEAVDIERVAPVTTEDLALHYGEDFPAWEEQWTERMRRTQSGLTIFHGPPGCGKTSYLRALMARLLDKAVFYFVPVSEAQMLFNPRFLTFWMKQTKRNPKKSKIVLLEDAEEWLLPRGSGSSDKVSNLLNLADGFLGDHLKLHVIATTNMPIERLDPAIARPGRLVGARQFPRLGREQALRLVQAKNIQNLPEQPDYSLAEIYCHAPVNLIAAEPRHFGFAKC